jgi:outer membrane protein with beta-barrel domain
MRKVVLLIVLVGVFSLLAVAADTPKAEVFGGYQFTHISAGGDSESFNGWNASLTGNLNKYFGVAADFSGAYKSISGVSVKVHSYTFGPVLSLNKEGKLNPFVHALFGGATASAAFSGSGASTNGFSMMIGGGADAKVSPHFAVRLVQADWVYYRFNGVGESNNARVSTGVVFRF